MSCSRQSALTSSSSRSTRNGGSIDRSFLPLITENTWDKDKGKQGKKGDKGEKGNVVMVSAIVRHC